MNIEKIIILIFIFFLLLACKRDFEEEIWGLPSIKLASLEKFPATADKNKNIEFILSCDPDEQRKYAVHIKRKVKQRGKNMPSLVADLDIELIMTEKIISSQNNICSMNVSFNNIKVSVEPDIEQIKNDLAQSFTNLLLTLSIDQTGKLVNLKTSGNSNIDTNSVNRIISDIKALRPVFPERILISGDSWDSSYTEEEPLPSNGKKTTTISAISTFKGFFQENAVVVMEFKSKHQGNTSQGKISSSIDGDGQGLVNFLYDLKKKYITFVEFQEANHLKVKFGNKSKKRNLEELVTTSVTVKLKNN